MSAFQDIEDQQDAADVELSDNVAEDFIQFFRGNVVGHEERGYLMYLGMLSGWVRDNDCHINTIGLGPPGSGKSLTKNTVSKLFDDGDIYTKTDASSNAILDSVEWDLALAAPLDELDKIDKAITEVLKSSNPVDDGYSKDRNVEDSDARGGYSPEEVSAAANPWVTLYAPTSSKPSIDKELRDRALLLYFNNTKHTRRGIMRKEFGHENIELGDDGNQSIYDTHELAAKLRNHVRQLPTRTEYEEVDGERYPVSRTGDSLVYIPAWVVYAVEPIFNIDEDYANRTFSILVNLIKSSTLSNYHSRSTTEVELYVEEDSTETKTRDAYVVEPQDVANVLLCFPTLLSTTHQLTPLKRHILDAVDATQSDIDGDGTTVSRVQDYLEDNDIPHPTRSTLKDRMDELAEEYYLDRFPNSGGKNGRADVYEQPPSNAGAIETPRIYDLDDVARRVDDVELPVDDCVDIDPSEPFADCHDPIRDQPFEETVRDFEHQFSGQSEPDTDAASFMGPDTDESSSETSSGGQASLTDVSDDGVEKPTDDSDEGSSLSLSPEGEPDNPTEQYVVDAIAATDGPFAPSDDVVAYVGAVPQGGNPTDVDMDGTVLSPDHELWQDRPDMTEDRIVTEGDCLSELHEAFKSLRQKDIVGKDNEQGPPGMYGVVVAENIE